MPVWGVRPTDSLQDALDQVWEELSTTISTNPAFEEVVGLPLETLVKHAAQAVATLTGRQSLDPAQVAASVQLYCLGFVVGTKYGERRTHIQITEKVDDS